MGREDVYERKRAVKNKKKDEMNEWEKKRKWKYLRKWAREKSEIVMEREKYDKDI